MLVLLEILFVLKSSVNNKAIAKFSKKQEYDHDLQVMVKFQSVLLEGLFPKGYCVQI